MSTLSPWAFPPGRHRVHGDRQRCSPGAGWEYVHVAVDDHAPGLRRGLPDQRGPACRAFLERAITWYRARGISCARVLSDNGSGYRSRVFREACAGHGPPPSPDPAVHATHQRQSGAVHPDAAARVGVREPYATSQERRRALRPWCGTTTASAHTPVSAISRRSPGCRELPDEQRV